MKKRKLIRGPSNWYDDARGGQLDQVNSRSKLVTFNGRTQTVATWARELGVDPNVIRYRLRAGWPVEKALQ